MPETTALRRSAKECSEHIFSSQDKKVEKTCPFCNCKAPVLENSLACATYDLYPVNNGHLLVTPKRHYADFFDSTKEELDAIFSLIWEAKRMLDAEYTPDGYNIGVNCGIPSGQTIMHLHVHLIPRYTGDVEDPTGGVRGVIPAKQKYPTGNR
jgi:diadenosine tetraphosphate (Ap4A) HIT family hydrolase